ncbi:MAG: ATP-binding protein [Prevotellaceae bacterium]|nr:ATP-binding protein [Prevotellaceae bacterium]
MENVSKTFPVVLITGPRQVGKTTLFEKSKENNRTYISLDDPQLRALAKNDPNLFLQTYKTPLLIDEIQYAPELFPYIKMAVDREKKKGMFWLTGSQQFHLMKNISESLAGRVAILELQGLSQAEKRRMPQVAPFLPKFNTTKKFRRMDVTQVYEVILRGSYPALFATPSTDKNIFYASYLKTYIERDIRTLVNISDEHTFLKFMRVTAARTGQMINYSDMARDVDVSHNTIKAWLSILETSGLIYLLQPFHNNVASRAIKTPKLYFLDTGLCCYLSGWDNAATLSNGAMSGAMLETYVISEILKSYWHNGLQASTYYYRDKDKKEIDLLIDRNGELYPIEVKRTASPKEGDIKNFDVLNNLKVNVGTGGIVCLYPNPTPLTQNINIIPVGYI